MDISKNEFVTKFKEFNITGMVKKIKNCQTCMRKEYCEDHKLEFADKRSVLERMREENGDKPKLFYKIDKPYPVGRSKHDRPKFELISTFEHRK
jgi:hypothetical protein